MKRPLTRNQSNNQTTPTGTSIPFENYFNSAGVVEIDGREEYSNPNGVKRRHGGGPHRTITTLV
ncbi:hypothetical protein A2U01_0088913 [Trifolium medium]|uniref:Uncharacterized protein n=1 Tax=Trifolium medium TaxID=97028 RepID=A0A392U4L7_9FABA|nr:hypothetical protein [Trifolium medium]